MKLRKKAGVVLLLITICMITMSTPIFAAPGAGSTATVTTTSGGSDYLDPQDKSLYEAADSKAAESTGKAAESILGIVQIVAITTAIIILIVIGIKYITAAPEGKAELKKKAIIYIVGAMLLFGATAIVGIIRTVANNSINN